MTEMTTDQAKRPSTGWRVFSLVIGVILVAATVGDESVLEQVGGYVAAAAFFIDAGFGGFRASPSDGWPYYVVRFCVAVAVGVVVYRLLLLL